MSHAKTRRAAHPVHNLIAPCDACGMHVFHTQDRILAAAFPSQFPEGFVFVPVHHHSPATGNLCTGYGPAKE